MTATPRRAGQSRVYLPHPEILSSLAKGHRILIDDGKVMLRVAAAEGGRALTVVEVAGRVSNKKGVSLPDTTIPTSAMTDKDRADLAAALEEDIDWIALSFVQRPEDIVEVKDNRQRPGAGDGQDRKAAGGPAHRGDHGRC